MYVCTYIEQQGCCNVVVHISTLTVAITEHRNRNGNNLVSTIPVLKGLLQPCYHPVTLSQSCHKVVSYNIVTDFSMGTYASFNDSKLAFMLNFFVMYVRTYIKDSLLIVLACTFIVCMKPSRHIAAKKYAWTHKCVKRLVK